jgi:tRNA(ile)-lysidine synthetase
MLDKVIKTISQFNMIKKGDNIVIGVSGGADSVCLLDVLNSLKDDFMLNLTIVHINHNIRGEEADRDEDYVLSLAEKYGIAAKVFSYQCEEMARETGIGTEEMGRRLRYNAFNEVAGKNGKIAVAHNINDNCETMLMNFFRGTGLKGLSGISPVRDNIIRPLISVTKAEIEQYCKERSLYYCSDSTNSEDIYTRNKMRLNVIPLLEKGFNKNLTNTMFRTSNIVRAEDEYIEKQALNAYDDCREDNHRINIDRLKGYDKVIQRRIVRIGFRDFLVDLHDISYDHVEGVLSLAESESGRIIELPQGLRASREYDTLYFYKEDKCDKGFCYSLETDKKQFIKEHNFYVLLTKNKKNDKNCRIVYTNVFDCGKINTELKLRSRQSGDRIFLKGIGGSKSIKKLFIDLKIPRSKRDDIPILAFENEVLWIKDYKTSDYYKASKETKEKLYLYITED